MTATIAPSQDLHPVEAEVQERLRASVPELAWITNADDLTEDILTAMRVPAALTMIDPRSSAGLRTFNRRAQTTELTILVGWVTQSQRSRAAAGSHSLREAGLRALKGMDDNWKPPSALGPLVFEFEKFAGREGARVCWEQRFKVKANLG